MAEPTQGATSGQEPGAASPTAGQAPAAQPQAGTQNTPATPATPSTSTPQGQAPRMFSEDYVEELRKEAAKHRTEKSQIEKRLKELEDAQLSEQERKDKRLKELEEAFTALNQQHTRLQEDTVLKEAIAAFNPQDAGIVLGLIDRASLERDAATGQIVAKSVAKQVEALKSSKGFLFKADPEPTPAQPAQGTQTQGYKPGTPAPSPMPSTGTPMNAARSNVQITRKSLKDMTADQINALWNSGQIQEAMRSPNWNS